MKRLIQRIKGFDLNRLAEKIDNVLPS